MFFNSLLFHEIGGVLPSHYSVNVDILKLTLDVVSGYGYDFGTIQSARRPKELADKNRSVVSLTFDDGYLSDYRTVLPLFLERKVCGTFFVVTSFVGKQGYMSWDHVRALADSGMEIGSHTHTHPFLAKLTAEDVSNELYVSKQEIENNLGLKVDSVSLPNGDYDNRVVNIAYNVGYKNICTSIPGLNDFSGKLGLIKRNAIHRYTKKNHLSSMVNPSPIKCLGWHMNYLIRKNIKMVVGTDRYAMFKDTFKGLKIL